MVESVETDTIARQEAERYADKVIAVWKDVKKNPNNYNSTSSGVWEKGFNNVIVKSNRMVVDMDTSRNGDLNEYPFILYFAVDPSQYSGVSGGFNEVAKYGNKPQIFIKAQGFNWDGIKSAFVHEFIHFKDITTRISQNDKDKILRKAGKSNVAFIQADDPELVNKLTKIISNPIEFNAYYQGMVTSFLSKFHKDMKKLKEVKVREIYGLDDVNKFNEIFLQTILKDYPQVGGLVGEIRKRFLKRLSGLFSKVNVEYQEMRKGLM